MRGSFPVIVKFVTLLSSHFYVTHLLPYPSGWVEVAYRQSSLIGSGGYLFGFWGIFLTGSGGISIDTGGTVYTLCVFGFYGPFSRVNFLFFYLHRLTFRKAWHHSLPLSRLWSNNNYQSLPLSLMHLFANQIHVRRMFRHIIWFALHLLNSFNPNY